MSKTVMNKYEGSFLNTASTATLTFRTNSISCWASCLTSRKWLREARISCISSICRATRQPRHSLWRCYMQREDNSKLKIFEQIPMLEKQTKTWIWFCFWFFKTNQWCGFLKQKKQTIKNNFEELWMNWLKKKVMENVEKMSESKEKKKKKKSTIFY